MATDMSLISMKDGGKFAMSWLAGTNPKALHSNSQRQNIYSVDIPEVCEDMIEFMKTKQDKLSFRILFRLCFGTINIFSQQVQHLYSATLNFVCFNNFVLKQYSRKRKSFSTVDAPNNKKTRLTSTDSIDITSLLVESELFNNCSEEQFEFPNEKGQRSRRKQSISTCIQVERITIKQVSWDNDPIEDEDVFGEASQDERSFLISETNGFTERRHSSDVRKRKLSHNQLDCTSPKRPHLSYESIDDLRYEPSLTYDESISEAENDFVDETRTESEKNPHDFNGNNISLSESVFGESLLEDHQSREQLVSECQDGPYALENSIQIPPPCPETEDFMGPSNSSMQIPPPCSETDDSCLESTIKTHPPQDDLYRSTVQDKRRPRRRIIIDQEKQISKDEIHLRLWHTWINCYDLHEKTYLISTEEPIKPVVFNKRTTSPRFQSDKLLVRFKKNLKQRLKQKHDHNRQLIVEDILGDNYEDLKHLFNIKSKKEKNEPLLRISEKPADPKDGIEEKRLETFQLDDNNNIQSETQKKNLNVEINGSYQVQHEVLTLKCPLDKIDPHAISFNFPLEAGKQRSEWGKEGIMTKLLVAWISESPVINMATIIVGASRINAALAFHTILDLAGQQYIEILKDETSSIESIKMGRELIRIINEVYA